MSEIIAIGTSRLVIFCFGFAIKIPNPSKMRRFLEGLRANRREVRVSKFGLNELCPVKFYLPFGICLIMPKVRALTEMEWANFDSVNFCLAYNPSLPIECGKIEHFGWLGERLVALDYGGEEAEGWEPNEI